MKAIQLLRNEGNGDPLEGPRFRLFKHQTRSVSYYLRKPSPATRPTLPAILAANQRSRGPSHSTIPMQMTSYGPHSHCSSREWRPWRFYHQFEPGRVRWNVVVGSDGSCRGFRYFKDRSGKLFGLELSLRSR